MPEDEERGIVPRGEVLPPDAPIPPVFWRQPKGKIIISGGILLAPSAWLFSKFFDFRGYVNLEASRIALALAVLCVIAFVWIWARNIEKPRFLLPLLLSSALILIAIVLDHFTLPKAQATAKQPGSSGSGSSSGSPAPNPGFGTPPNSLKGANPPDKVPQKVKPPSPRPAPPVAPVMQVPTGNLKARTYEIGTKILCDLYNAGFRKGGPDAWRDLQDCDVKSWEGADVTTLDLQHKLWWEESRRDTFDEEYPHILEVQKELADFHIHDFQLEKDLKTISDLIASQGPIRQNGYINVHLIEDVGKRLKLLAAQIKEDR